MRLVAKRKNYIASQRNVVRNVFVAATILARLGYSYEDIHLLVAMYVEDAADSQRLADAAIRKLRDAKWDVDDLTEKHTRVASQLLRNSWKTYTRYLHNLEVADTAPIEDTSKNKQKPTKPKPKPSYWPGLILVGLGMATVYGFSLYSKNQQNTNLETDVAFTEILNTRLNEDRNYYKEQTEKSFEELGKSRAQYFDVVDSIRSLGYNPRVTPESQRKMEEAKLDVIRNAIDTHNKNADLLEWRAKNIERNIALKLPYSPSRGEDEGYDEDDT